MKLNVVFGIFVSLMLLSSLAHVAYAQELRPGMVANNKDNDIVFTEVKQLTPLENILRLLFQPQVTYIKDWAGNTKGAFDRGEIIKFEQYHSLKKICSTGPAIVTEIYNAPVGQHTAGPNGECPYSGTTCVKSNSYPIGSGPGTYFNTWQTTIPSDAKYGTWSVSSYIYCPPPSTPVTDYASAPDEINFEVKQFTIVDPKTCGDGRIDKPNDVGVYETCDSNSQYCTVNGYDGTQACNNQCTGYVSCTATQSCGDKIKNGNEQCDDGPTGSSTCDSSCKLKSGGGGVVPPLDAPDFDIRITSAPTQVDSRQDNVPITVLVTNLKNTEGEMFVEAGIYDDDYLSTSGLLAVVNDDVPTCKDGETNVDAVKVSLDGGESVPVTFNVKAPHVCSIFDSGQPTPEYKYVTATYTSCSEGGNPDSGGKRAAQNDNLVIVKEFGLVCGTCSDGIKNADESDTDVGGRCADEGKPALLDMRCSVNKDCATGLSCQSVGGASGTTPICRPIEEEPSTVRTACPAPDATNVCHPEGCPYSDQVPALLTGEIAERTTYCCVGTSKRQQGEEDKSFLGFGYTEKTGICAKSGLFGGGSWCGFWDDYNINCTVATAFIAFVALLLFVRPNK